MKYSELIEYMHLYRLGKILREEFMAAFEMWCRTNNYYKGISWNLIKGIQ